MFADTQEEDDETVPVLVAWLPHLSYESIFALFGARQSVYMLIVAGVLGTLFALLLLPVSIAIGVPPWPASVFGFGYTLNVFNWFSGFFCLVAGTWRNRDLLLATAIILTVQFVVNAVAASLQIAGSVNGLTTLRSTSGLFTAISSMISVVLSATALTGAWTLFRLIEELRPKQPTVMVRGRIKRV